MKHSLTLATVFALAGATYSQAEEVLPPQYNFDRYSKMVDQSPFAVPSAVAAPAANTERSQDGDLVTIASTANHNFKKYLTTKEPIDGYSTANIEWSDKVGQTKVTISKEGNLATLTFNQALLSQASPGGGARPLPVPAAPIPNPAGIPNAHAPKLPANVPPELQQLIPSRDSM